MNINSKSVFRQNYLKLFSIVWVFVLIAPLIYFPGPAVLSGHPWKVELTASFLLFLISSCLLYRIHRSECRSAQISSQIVLWILAPVSLFVLWSGATVFEAGSTLSVWHHTLVWAGYLIFFLFALKIVSDKKD
jgi:hypothetical protein